MKFPRVIFCIAPPPAGHWTQILSVSRKLRHCQKRAKRATTLAHLQARPPPYYHMQLDRVSRLAYQSRCGATTLSRSLSGAYPARICVHATAAAAGVFADIVHAHTATELLWWHEPVSLAGRGMALQPPLQEHRRGQQKEQQQHKCHTPIAALLLRQGQGRLSYRQPFSTAALVSAPPEWRQWCKHSLRRRISVSARKFTTVPNKQAASGTISAPSSRLATSDTAENYYAAIKASGSAGQWERALSLLDEMWINGPSTLPPNSETYGEAIAACGSAGQWRQAVDLLQQMAGKGVAADDRCYREAIKACGDGEQWVRAVGLYNRMRMIGVAPGILSHNAIITALGKAGRLKEALAILKRMQQHQAQGRPDIAPDVGTYNAVIFACEEGGHWEQAFSLLEEMKTIGVRPNEESFCHVITACGKGKQWEQVQQTL